MAKSRARLFVCLTLALMASLILSLLLGASPIDLVTALRTGAASADGRIFYYIRLPRTMAACLAGVALSVAGAVIQGVLHNPLAGPNIVGVNAGAGFAALLLACLFPNAAGALPLGAFAGALAAGVMIFLLSARAGAGRLTVILAGVAVNAILRAGMDALRLLFPDTAAGSMGFLTGGFAAVSVSGLRAAAWYILPGLAVALMCSNKLNVLSLGDEVAGALGMRTGMTRLLLLALSALLAGAAVSFAGLLGFVGLAAPHVARKLTGADYRLLLPCAMLLGGAFVPLCDLLGRTVLAPYELPAGIVLSLLGGPFFLWLALRGRRRGA